MAWNPDIRDALVARLAGITVTLPNAQAIKKVYATPPATIQDLPCFIVYPPRREVNRGPAGRQVLYTVRCRCLVTDADLSVGADLVDAFSEATIARIEGDIKLAEAPVVGHVCEEGSGFKYGSTNYVGFDLVLTLNVRTAFAATA